jgi:hypothetical protein
MHALRKLFSPPAARHLLLLLLVGLLAVHGYAGAVRQVLGSIHRHDSGHALTAQAADPAALAANAARHAHPGDGLVMRHVGWQDHHARSDPTAWSSPAHRHGSTERHHHDIGDASVVALDAGSTSNPGWADGTVAAAVGGAELPTGLSHAPSLPATAASACPWPKVHARTWQNALTRLPERPPRA